MRISRTRRFLTSAFLIYAYQGVSLIVGLWIAPFLLGRLGQHDFGVWLIGFQVLSYLMLLDFGIVALLPREVAYATGRAQATGAPSAELALLVGQTARIVLYQMPVVLVVSAIAWFMIPAGWNAYRGVVGIVLTTFVCTFPLRIFAAILQGLQDVTFCGMLSLTGLLVTTAITVVLVLKGFGLYALAVSWAITQVLSIAASAYRVRSRFPEALPDKLPPMPGATLKHMLGRGFWVSLNQIAQPLLMGSDLVVLGKFAGAAAVVPFSATHKLTGVLSNQPQVLMQLAVPGLSELKAGASKEHVYNVTMAITLSVLLASGAIATGVLAINQAFVTRWLGAAQYGGWLLTALMSLLLMLRQWNLTAQFATYCFGHERRITIVVFTDGLVTVASMIGLVWLLGPIGAPLGSMLGVCLVSLPSNLKALGQEAELPVYALIRPLGAWLWRFLILVAAAMLMSYLSTPTTIPTIGIQGGLIGLLYCALMWPVAMRSPLGPYLMRVLSAVQVRLFGPSLVRPTTP